MDFTLDPSLDFSDVASTNLDFGTIDDPFQAMTFDASPTNAFSFPTPIANTAAAQTAQSTPGIFSGVLSGLQTGFNTIIQAVGTQAPKTIAAAISKSGTFGKAVVQNAANTQVNAGVTAFLSNPMVWLVLGVGIVAILLIKKR